jgi:co-chaperonin GroES (HSP10)
MEEQDLINAENLTQDDVIGMIKGFPLIPLRNKVIITMNTSEEITEDGVRISDNHLSESQYILATGSHVHEASPGNKVLLNLENMMEYTLADNDTGEKVGHIKLRPVQVNGRVYALVSDSVIDCIDAR